MIRVSLLTIILASLLVYSIVHCRPNSAEASFTFDVDEVEVNLEKSNDEQFVTPEEAFRKQTSCNTKLQDFSHKNDQKTKILFPQMNGIMSALNLAYDKHYPLRLSVSDFILMIGQGLAKHMEIYAEDVRPYFVDFEGKQKISIRRDEFVMHKQNDWSTVFQDFSQEIRKRTKEDMYDIIMDDTSVSSPLSKIASEITLMDAFKQYFEYEVVTGCGIPRITLVGSEEDWNKLLAKVQKLKQMNVGDKLHLDWWLDHLIPVVESLVKQIISKQVDKTFWQKIYKKKNSSGGPFISGWINVFNPYIKNYEGKPQQNPWIDWESIPEGPFTGISTSSLIDGISKIPFTWVYYGTKIPMNFYGGFLGAQITDDLTVETTYFYAVAFENDNFDEL